LRSDSTMRAVDAVVAELAARPGEPVSWIVGEPCFEPPPELADALVRAAESPPFRYPAHNGLPALREVLAARFEEEGHSVAPNQITITSGAKCGLLALFATLLEPGDELIHPQPCYPAYPATANRLGARPVAVAERDGDFSGWTEEVARHISPRTRAVVLASPSNPTGATLDAAEARVLLELCSAHGIRLICDEAYTDFRFTAEHHALPADLDPELSTVVRVRSASKSWALCGWRLGWITADASLVARVAHTHSSLLNPASGPAQAALCALPEVSADYLGKARSMVANRMDELCSVLWRAGLPVRRPEGGFYLWLQVKDLNPTGAIDAFEWCVKAARRWGVGLWPGDDFGGPGHVRISVTAPSDTEWQPAVKALVESLTAGE
ncbi:MAG: pyridoxal phosphate-dependent aminotransferase, partial [Thermoanaerobaculales bacterium]|nr:pyridoxal phosphate-dependent aminotransferase [Thermoanaerobaculales bacterium]